MVINFFVIVLKILIEEVVKICNFDFVIVFVVEKFGEGGFDLLCKVFNVDVLYNFINDELCEKIFNYDVLIVCSVIKVICKVF